LAPEWGEAASADEAREVAERIGYPVLVRPHYVISGRGMHVAHSPDQLRVAGPCLVDRYLEGALELDVDALCDGDAAWVAAVLEHVEPVGVHSGDSACVLPGPSVSEALEQEIRDVASRLAAALGAGGLLHLPPAQPATPPAQTPASSGSRQTRAPRAPCRSWRRRPASRSWSTPCGCCWGSGSARWGCRREHAPAAPGRRRPSSRPSASPAPRREGRRCARPVR